MVKHVRTDEGWIPDISAVMQLKTVEKVLAECDTIIAATEASREGEMTFRYLYRYLGCRQPVQRLWLSSLTDEAVRKGMTNLLPVRMFDRMFLASDSRNKADWLLGMNASYALCKATGLGNHSLGRVQTPVLAAVSSRYRERENHIGADSWPVYISMHKDGTLLKMRCTDEFSDRETALMFYNDCKYAEQARITSVHRQQKEVSPPAPYNLTGLQKDASCLYGLTAGQTADIAQGLYEKKLISYPRTDGHHIAREVYDTLPAVMEKVLPWSGIRPGARLTDTMLLPEQLSGNDSLAEHPAITVTGVRPEGLDRQEMQVYTLIAGRCWKLSCCPAGWNAQRWKPYARHARSASGPAVSLTRDGTPCSNAEMPSFRKGSRGRNFPPYQQATHCPYPPATWYAGKTCRPVPSPMRS